MDEKEKEKIINDLMKDKEAEELMKLAFIMYGYEDEIRKLTTENTPNQGE